MAEKFGTRPEILVDGTPLRDDVAALVERVVVDSSVHLADMVEISFRDRARDALTRAGIRIGSAVTVSTTKAGDGSQTPLVQAEITALECDFDELGTRAVARGYDHAHRMSRGRRTHSYNDVTDADIVRAVAGRAGVGTGDIAAGGPVARARRPAELHRLGVPAGPQPGDRSRGGGARRQAPLAEAGGLGRRADGCDRPRVP